jgi:branched-chain amino acid transport system ATP-binding protein
VALLETRDLSVNFGSIAAVDQVSVSVEAGTLVGLIGANGAGKTTLLDALTGFVAASGYAAFGGTELLGLRADRRAGIGLARTWQSVELFDDLTAYENLRVGAAGKGIARTLGAAFWKSPTRDLLAERGRMEQMLRLFELENVLDRYPNELSEGERKLLGLCRALMSEPKMILADEPAAGLDSAQSIRLGSRLRQLVDSGTTMLLVDHDMGLVLGVCDRIYVMDQGRVIAAGRPEDIRSDPIVLAAYLGDETGETEMRSADHITRPEGAIGDQEVSSS